MGRAACCWSLSCAAGAACLLGPCCSDRTPARAVFSLAALGGVRGCWRCCVGVGWVQKCVWWSRFEWSTAFEFLAVSSTNATRSVSIARAAPPPTQRLPCDLLVRCDWPAHTVLYSSICIHGTHYYCNPTCVTGCVHLYLSSECGTLRLMSS